MEILSLHQLNAVSGGNALDTTTGSFVPAGDSPSTLSPGSQVCYAVGLSFRLPEPVVRYLCIRPGLFKR